MEIRILQLLEGARQAEGLTVIIDVFRAFTVECYAVSGGVKEIFAVGDIEKAYALKQAHTDALLVGERGGMMCKGFDCGNSPSALQTLDLRGRTMIHTTSAGTQGIACASHAEEIITGSLVNASAVADYIRRREAKTVSLVCMGLGGLAQTEEDTLCAEYIRALLNGANPDITMEMESLRHTSGAKFFDPAQQAAFPQPDFDLCLKLNRFPFVLRAETDNGFWRMNVIHI